MSLNHLLGAEFSLDKTIIVVCAVLSIATLDIVRRMHHRSSHLFFATLLGTFLSIGLMQTANMFFDASSQTDSYMLALGILLVILCWRALFGPWEPQTKVTMLATFLFWIVLHLFWEDNTKDQSVRFIAAGVALIPAAIWCRLFLKYHSERLGNVLLLFFAGMLSTAPILFYDALVRKSVTFQFFFFSVRPESFKEVSDTFVTQYFAGHNGVQTAIVSSLVFFIFVALIEEVSKYWVVTRSGKRIFTSIDDVIQLSVIVAIGFSFAENIVNPMYFSSFVRDYLLASNGSPDVLAFISNVLGRSILTSMVHIVSTGVMGYFLGKAIFASSYLHGTRHGRFLRSIAHMLRLPEQSVFRLGMTCFGLLVAIALHALFNLLVSLPDLLPSHPTVVSDLLGNGPWSVFTHIPLLLFPALFYVVGGFWLLTSLFAGAENTTERGHVVIHEEYMDQMPEDMA